MMMAADQAILLDSLGSEEAADAKRRVYLVTLSRVLSPAAGYKDLGAVSREQVSAAVRDAFENPTGVGVGGRPRVADGCVDKLITFREHHSDGSSHFHVAVRLKTPQRFAGVKRALKDRHQLPSHFSSKHAQFFSAVKYGALASITKPDVYSSPHHWASDGRVLDVFAEAQEPYEAKLWKKRREEKDRESLQVGLKMPRFTKPDLTSIILSEKLVSKASVMAYAQEHGTTAMQAFIQNNQKHLGQFLQDAVEWEGAKNAAKLEATNSWDLLGAAAHCECEAGDQCLYQKAVEDTCKRNKENFELGELALALRKVLQRGPSKTSRVPLLVGPTNCGKSTLVQPFDQLFGREQVFHKPALDSKFALRNLTAGKRFILWDDYRPVQYGQETVPVVTFLSLFDGVPFEVQCSQSFNDGNIDFAFHGGAVFTAKERGLWTAKGNVTTEDVRHMQSRVHCFRLTGKPAVLRDTPPCHIHMSKWIWNKAAAADAALALKSFVLKSSLGTAAGVGTGVDGWDGLAAAAQLPEAAAKMILQNVQDLGALSVNELEQDDWESLPDVMALRPMERRRLLAAVAK